MSLSTLLEAAKYLDYLDSSTNQNQQHQPQQQHVTQSQTKPTIAKKVTRRSRFSKKSAANTMLAMSLPASTGPIQMQGVPIPIASGSDGYHATSLSSSFTTGSPLSSSASTALFCSKASGVTSASSSTASSLSSSDSSSSCGEILMGDTELNNQATSTSNTININHKHKKSNSNHINNNNHHNYHLTHQQFETNHQPGYQKKSSMSRFIDNSNNQSIARYIAATSTGPQLVTMTTSSSLASTSAPVDGNIRAGHVIHAANAAIFNATPSTSFDPRHFLTTSPNVRSQAIGGHNHEGQTFNIASASPFGSDNHLSSSPGNCPPLIMARVQPMILNSISPSSHHSIMAYQPAAASSPTSSSSSYSRHRELHKTLEKNRRAHLRHCFELLKAELPTSECQDKKTSHINIIRSAIRYVLILRQQELEIDSELQRLTRIKNDLTKNLSKMHITPPQSKQQSNLNESENLELKNETQQPAPEQQLSFLLSQSKID